MKIKTIFILVILTGLALTGCKKSSTDLASKIAGTYSGKFGIESNLIPGTSEIIRQTESLVTIRETMQGNSSYDITSVNVTDGGNGKVLLQRTSDTIHLTGTVGGNKFDFSTIGVDFSGTKQ